MADGSRHSMYLVPEATYGVTPATPTMETIRQTGTTLGLSKNTNQSEELRSDRQIADYRHGARQVGGDINFELSYSSFDVLLEAALGGTWQVDTPSVGIDELIAGTTRRSFSILREFADLLPANNPYHLFTGVEVNTFNLNVAPDSIITGSFSMLGQNMSTSSAAPAGSTLNPPTTTAVLDSFTGSLNEGGSQIAGITETSLTVENGLETRFVIGSDQTIRPQVGRSNVSGQITAFFEDSTLLNRFINENETSIEFNLPDAAGNNLRFFLPRIKYNGGQPDTSGPGSILLSMPFQALYDSVTGTNISIQRDAA